MPTKRTIRSRGPGAASTATSRILSSSSPAKVREHIAVFPGSFDPITFGHLDVIQRGRRLFDRLVVAVGRHPGKDPLFTPDERVEMTRSLIAKMVADEPDAAAVTVESFSGLTVDFARDIGATVLLRGIRNLSDLQNEVQQALTNREVAGLETAFIVAGQDFAYTSSSLIKQVTAMGRDLKALSSMVPAQVIQLLKQKKASGHPALQRLLEQVGVSREG
ncbi:MAG: pantetheine-phosphate adenylyltransferase [Pyrinomonadaceae bacterium]|nr:pantetheine-phosphate adenylyltransferase [Phycisphaerales bacterium]